MLNKVGQFVAALAILTAAVAIMAADKQYDVTVSSTITDNPRQIEFKVTVTNYDSKAAIFVPKIIANWGQNAKAVAYDKEGREVKVFVTFNSNNKSGTYEIIIMKDGTEVERSAGAFSGK